MKPATVAEVLQRIEEKIGEEIKAVPSHIRRYGVTNIFHRSLSYLFGWDEDDRPRKVRVDENGRLMVAGLTGGADNFECYTGLAGYNWSSDIVLSGTSKKVYVFFVDYPYEIEMSKDLTSYDIHIDVETEYVMELEIPIRGFRVRKKYGNAADYKIVVVY